MSDVETQLILLSAVRKERDPDLSNRELMSTLLTEKGAALVPVAIEGDEVVYQRVGGPLVDELLRIKSEYDAAIQDDGGVHEAFDACFDLSGELSDLDVDDDRFIELLYVSPKIALFDLENRVVAMVGDKVHAVVPRIEDNLLRSLCYLTQFAAEKNLHIEAAKEMERIAAASSLSIIESVRDFVKAGGA